MVKKFLILVFVLIMAGCSLNNPVDTGEATISFDYQLVNLISQVKEVSSLPTESRCFQNLIGKLTAINQSTGIKTEYPWYGKLNEETFHISSNKTIVLRPGTYDFVLDLKIGDYQYVGSVSGALITPDVANVPMTIYSVIGDISAGFELTQLSSLRFVYPADEFENIVRPKLGYIINDKREVLVDFDKNTGITQTYINLLPGSYRIKLKLYDGNIQIGRSIKEQESVTVTLKQNIVMDIIPLHVETNFTLTHEGGTACFNFAIPEEVVDEVGGKENLLIDFRLYSQFNEYKQEVIVPVETADGYTGSVSFAKFYYDTVTFAITFIDARDFEVIGASGQDGICLNSNAQQFSLEMELLRRSVVEGHLLAVLGLHVVNTNGVPVNGVLVYINDEYKGITGKAPGMADGYLKVYQKKGDCLIKAVYNSKYGTTTIAVDPLEVNNIEIVLDQTN